MKQHLRSALLAVSLSSFVVSGRSQGTGASLVWQIGKPDHEMKEFYLGDGRYRDFKTDPFFVVGRSKDASDWAYCHPGPDDAWAGNRAHSFSIVFGLQGAVANAGNCQLNIGLVGVGRSDIRYIVNVNGKESIYEVASGTGNAIYGKAEQGEPRVVTVEFPANLLRAGNNTITLTNEKGSWLVYDYIGLKSPAAVQLTGVIPAISITGTRQIPFIRTVSGREVQSAELSISNTGDPVDVHVTVKGQAAINVHAKTGLQTVSLDVPAVAKDSSITVQTETGGKIVATTSIGIRPVPKMTIYILPHSHNDIGYTEIQSKVEEKQLQNLLTGMEYARKTRNYPEGAHFVWNLEGVYAANLFMERMNDEQRKAFREAVKNGDVALNGMYLNTLTGLCRPEELLNLFKYGTKLSADLGVKTDAAMISDVPGYTWGTVSAMAQAGIKYFSAAPNFFDRIGDILQQWEDKPFYWLSPSGKEKVLVWVSHRGYALSHELSHPDMNFVTSYMQHLADVRFPYSISYIRWSGHGDNAVPDEEISEFVKDWNTKYTWPHFVISSTSKAFHAFEDRYAAIIPSFKGDWTGYWEDGAGSSAYETSENRTSSARLSQAGALWAMHDPEAYPGASFADAWRHVILYSEHTWGADISVSDPLSQKTKEQWEVKKSYATKADSLSEQLLRGAVAGSKTDRTKDAVKNEIAVYNTNSWLRTGLVLVPAALSTAGDGVRDEDGKPVATQRLSTGELAFVASGVSAFGSKKFTISPGKSSDGGPGFAISPNTLDNGIVRVTVDPVTGSINGLWRRGSTNNFSDSVDGHRLNEYLFLKGDKLSDLQVNGPVSITVKERGPVLTTLVIESSAPGCKSLRRTLRLCAGTDYVEIDNLLDKEPAELNPHPGDYQWANTGGKESLHIAFPFHVPGGQLRLDIPMAVMRPDKDQIPGSCKNWLEVGSWADVSNAGEGVTWATLDAPLVEAGEVSAILLGGQSNPDVWRKNIAPTQTLYSWALNNHWETNYRAYQEGLLHFRYALQPHGGYDAAAATRFATGLTQPLIVGGGENGLSKNARPVLSSDKIVALVFKPGDDKDSYILTLYNPTETVQETSVKWSKPEGAAYYSNTAEEKLAVAPAAIRIEPMQVVTLKIARKPA